MIPAAIPDGAGPEGSTASLGPPGARAEDRRFERASFAFCHGDDGDSRAWSRAVPTLRTSIFDEFHPHEGQSDLQVLDNRVQSLTVVRDPVSEQARRKIGADRAIDLVRPSWDLRPRDIRPPRAIVSDERWTGETHGYRVQRQASSAGVDVAGDPARRHQIFIRFPRGRNVELAMDRLAQAGPAGPPRLHGDRRGLQKSERLFCGQVASPEKIDRPSFPGVVALVIDQHPRPQERR